MKKTASASACSHVQLAEAKFATKSSFFVKKVFLNCMLLLCALIVGSGSVWAAEQTVSWTASSGALGSTISAVNGTATGSISTGSFTWGYTRTLLYLASGKKDYIAMNGEYLQCGSGNAKESLSFTTSNIPGTIKSISVNCYSKDGKHNLSIAVDGTSYFNGATPSSSNTKTGTGTSSGDIEISFTLSSPSSQGGALYIKSISVTYETSAPSHTLTYSATNGSITGVDGGSNPVTTGASVAESATVTLTATPSPGYRFSSWSVDGTGSELSSTSTNPTTFTMGTDNATVTANFEVDNTVATPSFNPDGSATYTEAQDVEISCATIGATIHYTINGNDPTEEDPTYSSAVSITTSNTILKAKAFKNGMDASDVASATYTIKPNKPTVSAVGPTVTITGDNGLSFYYTTDGSTPTNSSTEYTAPFNLIADCTIKARAYDSNSNASDVTSFTYKYFPLIPKNINSGYFVKVTDASTLENGDAILIVNETGGKALGPQSGNNCPAKSVTISDGVINGIGNAQKLVLVKQTEKVGDDDTDVFYFYTGTGYLYAASSSSNHLKEQDPATSNARATISFSSGNADITFQGNYTRNIIRYNDGSDIFSCYSTGQKAVQIYKEVPAVTVSSAGWTTYVAPENVYFPTGVTGYIASITNASSIHLTEISAAPKGTAVVIKAGQGTHELEVVDAEDCDNVTSNILQASDGSVTGDASTIYALGVGKVAPYVGQVGFFLVQNGVTVPAGKAYLTYSGSGAPSMLRIIDEENNATYIQDIEATDGVVKFFENGRILIKKNGIVYDALGRIVK